jgi:uncharacterized SAM-binding protein YcdF (DUF218 family)
MSVFKNVLIVLGCSPKADGRPSDCMLSRIRKTIHLYKKNNYSRVILSGGPSRYRVPESVIMHVILINHLPHDRLVVERHSRNTIQNAIFCWEILKSKEVKHVTVVTSQHHLPRTKYIFRKLYSHMGVSLDFEAAPDTFDPIEKVYYHVKEKILLLWLKIFGIH